MSESVSFSELVDTIGEISSRQLIERWGGVELYVPKTPTADSDLARQIGLGPAAQLCSMFAGCQITLPLGAPGESFKRREIQRLLIETTLSHKQIARQVGSTDSWVRRIAAEVRNETQEDLFAPKQSTG